MLDSFYYFVVPLLVTLSEWKRICWTVHFLSVEFDINIRTVHAIMQYLGCHMVHFLMCPMPTDTVTRVALHVSITRAFQSWHTGVMCLSGDCFVHWDIVSPFGAHDKNSRHTMGTPKFTLTKCIQVTNVCWYSGDVGVIWYCKIPASDLGSCNNTTDANHYSLTLPVLYIKNKCLAKLMDSTLLHDTAHLHVVYSSGPPECHVTCSIPPGLITL